MYCRNCGRELNENAAVCVTCGASVGTGNKFCPNCGAETTAEQAVCLKCGVNLGNATTKGSSNNSGTGSVKATRREEGKLVAGVCSGIAYSTNCNPWLIRLPFILAGFFGIGLIAYIIAVFLIPKES